MLPSKGHFLTVNCPYYENGNCERPHCHFKHSKKEKELNRNDPLNDESTNVNYGKDDSLIKQLVKETVKQVLTHAEIRDKDDRLLDTSVIVDNVVSTLRNPVSINESTKESFSDVKATPSYRPTPIAELSRRHIPVQYAPTRPTNQCISRKAANASDKNMLVYTPSIKSTTDVPKYNSYTECLKPTLTSNAYEPSATATYAPTKLSNCTTPIDKYKPKTKYKNVSSLFSDAPRPISPHTYIPTQIVHESSSRCSNQIKEMLEPIKDSNLTKEIKIAKKGNKKVLTNIESTQNVVNHGHYDEVKKTEHIPGITDNDVDVSEAIVNLVTDNEVKKTKCSPLEHPQSTLKTKSCHKTNLSKTEKSSDKTSKSARISSETINEENNKKCSSYKESSMQHSLNDLQEGTISKSGPIGKYDLVPQVKDSSISLIDSVPKKTCIESFSSKNSELEILANDVDSKNANEQSSKSPEKLSKRDKHHTSVKSNKTKHERHSERKKSRSSEKSSKSNKTKMDCKSSSTSGHNKDDHTKHHKRTHNSSDRHKHKHRSSKTESSSSVKHKRKMSDGSTNRDKRKLFKHDGKQGSSQSEEKNEVSSPSDVEVVSDNQSCIIINDSSSSSSSDHYLEASAADEVNSATPENKKRKINDAISSLHAPSSLPFPNVNSTDPEKKRRKINNPLSSVQTPPTIPFPSSLCERWRKAKEQLQKSNLTGKLRISSVPNVSSLLNARDKLLSFKQPLPKEKASLEDTVMPNFKTRVAHKAAKYQEYPVCEQDPEIVIPLAVRQHYLNSMFSTYAQFIVTESAQVKAKTTELLIAKKVQSTKTYQNSIAIAILRIRKTNGEFCESDKKEEEIPDNNLNDLTPKSVPEFTYGLTIFDSLSKYTLTNDEYVLNGFPLPHPTRKNCAYIDKSARRPSIKQPDDPNQRICCNCGLNYFVDDEGFPISENDCFYHWGRLYKIRGRGSVIEKYRCCNAEVGSEPCVTGRYHVSSLLNDDCLEGFISTSSESAEPKIYALDCEMCYTKVGMELARCTLLSIDGKIVLDSTVRPSSQILDYCTRFSGITEDMINNCTTTFSQLRERLLSLLHKNTIVLGHSLENDFKALKIFHRTVVDTSVVFPHKMGLPYKMSLKRLAKEKLDLTIQDKEEGHDSKEDADACIKLMLWKVKEDSKQRRPRVIISIKPA